MYVLSAEDDIENQGADEPKTNLEYESGEHSVFLLV